MSSPPLTSITTMAAMAVAAGARDELGMFSFFSFFFLLLDDNFFYSFVKYHLSVLFSHSLLPASAYM